MKKIKINDNTNKKAIIAMIIMLFIILIFILLLNTIINYQIAKEVSTTVYEEDDLNFVNDNQIEWFSDEENNKIDINEIISKNLNDTEKEKIETEVVELEYETEYKNNSKLPKGMVKVLQQGQDGKQELIIRKKYQGENEISNEQIGRKIVTPCINKIVEVGTSSYYDKHIIKVGDTVYSTPYSLSLKEENKKNAEVLIKINQDSKLKVIKKSNSWYYVQYESYYGWVEEDCVTYINPNKVTYNNSNTKYSRAQLLAKLNKNMNLMKPSGLTIEQFKKVLSNNNQDKNGIFEDNAEYFYYIEQQYGINGVFVASIGIHESAWGTSKIATNKKNLFGYGAYDMSAYASAYSYNGYAAGIDMIARVLVKHYLNPKGTSIYNGEIATGKYYSGNTLSAVNKKYATDKNWNNAVYKWMQYLYNKL